MRDRSIEIPPCIALTWPSSEEPMPNGTIGARCREAACTIALTSSVLTGKTTASGAPAACHDSPWLWCSICVGLVVQRSPSKVRRSPMRAARVVSDRMDPISDVLSVTVTSLFTRKTLAFLRALKRNNDREWFRSRKPQYEQHVRGPMIELLARLAADFRTFAPELIADPRVSLYRIYRDTRFSDDKTPLKTHIAAHFPAKGFARNEGAGLYLEIAPAWVWIGGGLYMPSAPDLQAIREHIAAHHRALHRIVTAPSFRRAVGTLDGEQLSRVPRGYLKDHPAAGYLRFKQFLAGCEFEAELAVQSRFYSQVLTVFRAVAPLVRFLNAPLLAARRANLAPHRAGVRGGDPAKVRPYIGNGAHIGNVGTGLQTRPGVRQKRLPPDAALLPDPPRSAPRRPDPVSRW